MVNANLHIFTCGSLFAGIGGFCFGFEKNKFQTKWSIDNNKWVREVYSLNFPENRLIEDFNGDITEISVENCNLSSVDVLHAGFPCQSFSIAGNKRGFDDPRGKLFFEIIRLLEEWDRKKPKIIVLENSPHILNGGDGMWFYEIRQKLVNAGYWFSKNSCIEIDTSEYSDTPQKRNRLFMFAFNKDYFNQNKIHIKKPRKEAKDITRFVNFDSLQEDYYYLAKENRYYKMIMEIADDKKRLYQLRKYRVRKQKINVCPTLTANMGLGGHNVPFLREGDRLRKLTERECLNLQGFPSKFLWPSDLAKGKKYEMIGNAVSPAVSSIIAKELKIQLEKITK